jgi:hypothetical protein
LVGKAAAKRATRRHTPVLGKDLDDASVDLNFGQTKGLPIGPDTSYALAELILCAVDIMMVEKLGPAFRNHTLPGLRITDDFEFYAGTISEAEDVLLAWETAAAHYELQVNPSKTRIRELPTPLQDRWQIELSRFVFRSGKNALINDLYAYFSLAFEAAAEHPTSSVIAWALQRITSLHRAYTDDDIWSRLFDLILASVVTEPAALRFSMKALQIASEEGRLIDHDSLGITLNQIANYHARLEHGSEVAWALYLMILLGIPLEDANAQAVAAMEDNASLLLLRCLDSHTLLEGTGVDWTSSIDRAEAAGALESSDWLLAYEFVRQGWANSTELSKDPWFSDLSARAVSFFVCPPPVDESDSETGDLWLEYS